MKQGKSIECLCTIRLTFDDKSKEFQDAFRDYRESIYSKAGINDVLTQVAFSVLKFGSEQMIEGIGYVSVNGVKRGEPFSGIDVETDDLSYEFDVRDELPY